MELPEGEMKIITYYEAKVHARLLLGFSIATESILREKKSLIGHVLTEVEILKIKKETRTKLISDTEDVRKIFIDTVRNNYMTGILMQYVGYINDLLDYTNKEIREKQMQTTRIARFDANAMQSIVNKDAPNALSTNINRIHFNRIRIPTLRMFAKFLGATVIVK
ncbi:MAG: hypothetical protein WCK31_02250 [bacterium]